MAIPSEVFTEMVTTTLRNHERKITDNVTNHNALLRLLKDRKKVQSESGGYEIARPLEYNENETYQRYSGYDTLNIGASDVLTSAKFDWMQAAIHVTANGKELKMNNSKERMINLVNARIKNAVNTAANQMSVDIYSDGSLTNQIGGLAHLIQSNGQGTVGGINSATHTFWRNKFHEMAGTDTWSKSTIKGEMNQLWLKCVRGKDKPDLIIMSHDVFSAYEESIQDLQRYGDVQSASVGFEALKYKTASVIFDDNTNFGTTAEVAYFLNTDYLYLVQHPQARWTQDDRRTPVNQDAIVVPMYWMGNVVVTNRARQGKLIDEA
jgi:hypothetical protein